MKLLLRQVDNHCSNTARQEGAIEKHSMIRTMTLTALTFNCFGNIFPSVAIEKISCMPINLFGLFQNTVCVGVNISKKGHASQFNISYYLCPYSISFITSCISNSADLNNKAGNGFYLS